MPRFTSAEVPSFRNEMANSNSFDLHNSCQQQWIRKCTSFTKILKHHAKHSTHLKQKNSHNFGKCFNLRFMPQKRVIAKLRLPIKTVALHNFANKPLPSFEIIFMKYKGSFTLQQFCCDQQLMLCVAFNLKIFTARHCISHWLQQNCCSVNEP